MKKRISLLVALVLLLMIPLTFTAEARTADEGQPEAKPVWIPVVSDNRPNEYLVFWIEYAKTGTGMYYKLKIGPTKYQSCFRYNISFTQNIGDISNSWSHWNISEGQTVSGSCARTWCNISIVVKNVCYGTVYRTISNIPLLFDIYNGQTTMVFGDPKTPVPYHICKEIMFTDTEETVTDTSQMELVDFEEAEGLEDTVIFEEAVELEDTVSVRQNKPDPVSKCVVTDSRPGEHLYFWIECKNSGSKMQYSLKLTSCCYQTSGFQYDIAFVPRQPGGYNPIHMDVLLNQQIAMGNIPKGWYDLTITVKNPYNGATFRKISNIPVLFDVFNGTTDMRFGPNGACPM
jgi:hypothetical protein